MRSGFLEVGEKELCLKTTMEVGQTFSWYKESGQNLYTGEGDRYYTTKEGNVLVVWQEGGKLHYRATGGMEKQIKERLRLYEPLEEIVGEIKGTDEVLDKALKNYRGLRILKDDMFPCLISYLCSPQMRIPRIKKMFNSLAGEYGSKIKVEGKEYLQFPTVEQLSKASEKDLRELGIGYRAKYIEKTVQKLMDGVVDLEKIPEIGYRKAHDEIQKLYGVGDKVADCVLLFGAGYLEAFPIDTWIKKAVSKHYPEMYDENYKQLAENFRNYFGKYTGYAQEYLFHHIRNQENSL